MRNTVLASAAIEMRRHKQNEKESLLDHGIAVAKALDRILRTLQTNQAGEDFVPDIILRTRDFILKET